MPGHYTHTDRSSGTVLTNTIYNLDHQNHVDNFIPSKMDDYSASVAEMRTITSPGTVGAEAQATTLAGEIERLRYALEDIRGSGTRWYGKGPIYNVRSPRYGAVGDGVANDTAALQAAINDAINAGGGEVYCPRGDYLITSKLTLGQNVQIRGAGRFASNIKTTSAITMMEYAPASITEARITFQDISFWGQIGTTTCNLHLLKCADVSFQRATFRNALNGVMAENCYFLGFYDCRFESHTNSSVVFNDDGSGLGPVNGWCFHNCNFASNDAQNAHMYLRAAGWGQVSNCDFEGANLTSHGLRIGGFLACTKFTNNFFELYLSSAVILDASGKINLCQFHGNHIHCANSISVDLSTALTATSNDNEFVYNRFPSNQAGGTLLHRGTMERYVFAYNTWDNNPNAVVNGHSANLLAHYVNTRAHYRSLGQFLQDDEANVMRYDGTLAVGADTNVSFSRSAEVLNINSTHATGVIKLRTAGADTVVVSPSGIVDFKGTADLTVSAENGAVGVTFSEMSSDANAPAGNQARLYARDNGAGKTQLVVRFNSGAVQVLATEP